MVYVNLDVWNVKRLDECKGFLGFKVSKQLGGGGYIFWVKEFGEKKVGLQ